MEAELGKPPFARETPGYRVETTEKLTTNGSDTVVTPGIRRITQFNVNLVEEREHC